MKIYTLIGLLLFINIVGICQDKKKNVGYINLSAGALKLKQQSATPQFTFEIGARGKSGIAFGAGGNITSFRGDNKPFIPIFAELSYIKYEKKPTIYGNLRAGYSIYSKQIVNSTGTGVTNISTTGGFYSAFGLGVFLPLKVNRAAFLAVHYIATSLNTKTTIQSSTSKSGSDLNGFSISFGINLN